MKYKLISTFLRNDNEADDTGRLQRLLDDCVTCDDISIIDEELIITNTIYLRGNKLVYNIEGTSFNTIIHFKPSTYIPLFEIMDSKVGINSEEIIYNYEQFIENSSIKNIRFKGNNKGYFSKFIVYRFTIFDRVYISHFNSVFVGGAFIYLSEIKNSKIEYIHENIFSNVRVIDSYIRHNYFTGNIQIDEEGSVYFPDLFSNKSKISGTCIENNWIETFNTVFDNILGGSRIINNLFDYVIRIVERSLGSITFCENIVTNYGYESIDKYFKHFSNECIIRSDIVNRKYYLIYLSSGMNISGNSFTGLTPVYYIISEYNKNSLGDLLISDNCYIGYNREYKLIFYNQYSNNSHVYLSSENGRIEDKFNIKNLSDYPDNSMIEGISFYYNGMELISEKVDPYTVSLRQIKGDFINSFSIIYYVNSINGNNQNDGFKESSAFKTIKAAILKIPAVISNIYIINITEEVLNETLTLINIAGSGSVVIQSSNSDNRYIKNINIQGCSNITIKNVNCENINILNSNNIFIESSYISSSNMNGILIKNSTTVIRNTTFECSDRGITAAYFSKVISSNNNGNCKYSLVADQCSTIIKDSDQSSGSIITFKGSDII